MNSKKINNPDKTVDFNFCNKLFKGICNEGVIRNLNFGGLSQDGCAVGCGGRLDGPANRGVS